MGMRCVAAMAARKPHVHLLVGCGLFILSVSRLMLRVICLVAFLFINLLFFFSSRRRHTRWPRDWSSDVCSSDLGAQRLPRPIERITRSPPAPGGLTLDALPGLVQRVAGQRDDMKWVHHCGGLGQLFCCGSLEPGEPVQDRKSTRLNSSHVAISYAVFCLKKKTKYSHCTLG